MGKTRRERQAIDRAAVKCWRGNVAGLGQTLCGRHRDEDEEKTGFEARIEALEARVAELEARIADERVDAARAMREACADKVKLYAYGAASKRCFALDPEVFREKK